MTSHVRAGAFYGKILGAWLNVGDPIPVTYDPEELDTNFLVRKYDVAWDVMSGSADGEKLFGDFFINMVDFYASNHVVWGRLNPNAATLSTLQLELTKREALGRELKEEDGPRDEVAKLTFLNSLEFTLHAVKT